MDREICAGSLLTLKRVNQKFFHSFLFFKFQSLLDAFHFMFITFMCR